MRKSLLAVWLVLPIGAWAYHEGPGQDQKLLDDIDRQLREAHAFATDNSWNDAVTSFEEALKQLPQDQARAGWRIKLALNKARMRTTPSQLPRAHPALQQLVEELMKHEQEAPELLAEARTALANSQYYMTWLMRLEGLPREKWEPEIEAARQTYRLLAENAGKSGDEEAIEKNREDLESAIRLARMELKDLQGLPLPSQ